MNTKTISFTNKDNLLAELARQDEKTKLLLYYSEQLSELKARLASGEITLGAAKVQVSVLRQSRRLAIGG